MTVEEFNKKYADYLETGHYGLDINIPEVIAFLDQEFERFLIHLKGFKYQQIKLKFNRARFLFKTNIPIRTEASIALIIEQRINELVKKYDENKKLKENDN